MSNYVQEKYEAFVCQTGATIFGSSGLGGFLATASGTLTITTRGGTVKINAVPVTAGIYTPFPMVVGADGGTITLAGGATGTLFVS